MTVQRQAQADRDASIQENITFGVPVENIDKKALENAVSIAQLQSLIAQLPEGLQTPIGEKGLNISGGQRPRIGIARALYRDPDLIMDEATRIGCCYRKRIYSRAQCLNSQDNFDYYCTSIIVCIDL